MMITEILASTNIIKKKKVQIGSEIQSGCKQASEMQYNRSKGLTVCLHPHAAVTAEIHEDICCLH